MHLGECLEKCPLYTSQNITHCFELINEIDCNGELFSIDVIRQWISFQGLLWNSSWTWINTEIISFNSRKNRRLVHYNLIILLNTGFLCPWRSWKLETRELYSSVFKTSSPLLNKSNREFLWNWFMGCLFWTRYVLNLSWSKSRLTGDFLME